MSYIQILCTYLCLAQVSSAAPSPKKRWAINTNNTVQDSPIFVDDGRIVVFGTEAASSKRTENNGSAFFVYGVDAKTGHEHWSFQAPGHPCTAIFALFFIIGIFKVGMLLYIRAQAEFIHPRLLRPVIYTLVVMMATSSNCTQPLEN